MTSSFARLLAESGQIDPSILETLAAETESDAQLLDAIVAREILDAKTALDLRASQLGVAAVEINPYSIDPSVVRVLPEEQARRFSCIPLFRVGNDLTLALADPSDVLAIDQVAEATGCEILPVLALGRDIERAIHRFYGIDPILKRLVDEAQRTEATVESPRDEGSLSLDDLAEDQSPVVRIVNVVVLKAIRDGASDVHIEPDHGILRVRYRVDGRLQSEQHIPLSLHAPMVSRLKILADLDLAQKRLPQDGRISLHADGRRIDLRVSTLPTVRGEKVVMRLLDTEANMTSLEQLGLADTLRERWEELIGMPHGMILVTGPTGSGKTTTLYASLAAINKIDTNIVTVEDPVEFDFPIINQVQVNAKSGLTFSAALRSILRQDPNVVMVGEIRDRETAQIAVRAALTGHLVLSTLHTNDASSATTRLIDMGVEPYLVASALKGVLAQRLVRRSCPDCTAEVSVESIGAPVEVTEIIRQRGLRIQQGEGCRNCADTGYRGRVALHELLWIDDEVERAIVRQRPASEIRQIARRNGMVELFEDGLAKVAAGLTTVEQVMLATRIEEEEDPVNTVAKAVETVTEAEEPPLPVGGSEV